MSRASPGHWGKWASVRPTGHHGACHPRRAEPLPILLPLKYLPFWFPPFRHPFIWLPFCSNSYFSPFCSPQYLAFVPNIYASFKSWKLKYCLSLVPKRILLGSTSTSSMLEATCASSLELVGKFSRVCELAVKQGLIRKCPQWEYLHCGNWHTL